MNRRAVLLLPGVLAACSSPDPLYYTLRPVPGATVRGGPKVVELRRIGLAGYLDRPEIVRQSEDYRLRIPGGERWGEPLGEMTGRILAEDLNSRMPGTSVFTATGSISAVPDATVEVNLQRFDVDAQGQVILLAQVAVTRRRGRDTSRTDSVRLQVTPAGATTTGQVAAMSAALGQLADRIARLLG